MADAQHAPTSSFIIGDRFAGFGIHSGIRTVSQFLKDLREDDVFASGDHLVWIGQGISRYEWDLVRAEVSRHKSDKRIWVQDYDLDLSGRGEVHKSGESNVLIANLSRGHDGTCRADLRIHNDNELLLDHQTSQHVQGMVAVEASRQMFLGVTERFYLPSESRGDFYFVITAMETEFKSFLFPLPATIQYTVLNSTESGPTKLGFTAQISIEQAGVVASVTRVDFIAFDVSFMSDKEYQRAARVVESLRAEASDAARELRIA
jgi:hypothetical protein